MKKQPDNLNDAALLRQKAEKQLQRQQSGTGSVSEADMLKLIHELEVHQIELEMQNEELVTAREKAEIAGEKYTELYDFAPSGYFTITRDGVISELNFAAAKMLGKERSALQNSLFDRFVSSETKPAYNRFLKETFSSKTKETCEVTLTVNGQLPMHVALSGICRENGQFCNVTAIDITDRRKAIDKLQESEFQYKNLADSDSALIWSSGLDKLCNYFNTPWLKFTGRTLEQEMGNGWTEGVHPDDFDRCLNTYVTAFDKREAFEMEYRLRHSSGEYRWILDLGAPNFNSKGEFVGYIGHCFDISERKQEEKIREIQYKIATKVIASDSIEQLLEFVRSELGQLFDTANFFVALYNAQSDTLKKLYGVDEVDIFDEWDAERSFSGYVVKTGKILLLNKHEIAKLGTEQNIPILGKPAECWMGVPLIVDKRTIGVLVIQSYTDPKAYDTSDAILFEKVAQDLSVFIEKNIILRELNFAKLHAEESDHLKSAFLANMSHEIRTPMNGILGFAGLLKNPGLTGEKQQEFIRIIEKSGNRMLNIINDIIDISKIEAGLMKLNVKESNVNELIEYIYTFFKPEVEAKGMNLSFDTPLIAKEATIATDREKLYAILTNLVKNAIKYSKEGTIEIGYSLKTTGETTELEFFVKDTGIGIPEHRQEAIFERFIQADVADEMARQGAGLGLSISKAYVQMLGGKIWVESEAGIGSTFYFTLPYNGKAIKETRVPQPAAPDKSDQVRRLKILIAEDDEVSGKLFELTVKMFAKEILNARTGIEAVRICRESPDMDLVLMDIRMPEMNGYEATRRIRQFNKDVVIIAQTAYGLSGDREKAIEAGCNDHIAKPINANELLALFKKYFGN